MLYPYDVDKLVTLNLVGGRLQFVVDATSVLSRHWNQLQHLSLLVVLGTSRLQLQTSKTLNSSHGEISMHRNSRWDDAMLLINLTIVHSMLNYR